MGKKHRLTFQKLLWPVLRTADDLREKLGGEEYWQRRRHALKRAKKMRPNFEKGDLVGLFRDNLSPKTSGRWVLKMRRENGRATTTRRRATPTGAATLPEYRRGKNRSAPVVPRGAERRGRPRGVRVGGRLSRLRCLGCVDGVAGGRGAAAFAGGRAPPRRRGGPSAFGRAAVSRRPKRAQPRRLMQGLLHRHDWW